MKSLAKNLDALAGYLSRQGDCKSRRIETAAGKQCVVLYIESMTDTQLLCESVLRTLLNSKDTPSDVDDLVLRLTGSAMPEKLLSVAECTEAVSDGLSVLMVDGIAGAVSLDTRSLAKRSISESSLDKALIGARDGFVESLMDNISLVRRRLRSPALCVKTLDVGTDNVKCAIVWMDGCCDAEIVNGITAKLQSVKKTVLTVGDLRRVLFGCKTMYPLLKTVERPDTVCSLLTKGKAAVLLDGQPLAMCAPVEFKEFYESPNDASIAPALGRFMQILRMVSSAVAVVLPAIYVVLLSFNRELLPREAISMLILDESQVPIPLALEVFIVDILILIIFEVGVSLPSAIAGTIGIFGSVVLGEALISSHISGAITLLIATVSAICGYTVPSYPLNSTIKLMRYFVLLLSSVFGFVGLGMGVLLIAARLLSLKSVGKPLINMRVRAKKPPYVTCADMKEPHD